MGLLRTCPSQHQYSCRGRLRHTTRPPGQHTLCTYTVPLLHKITAGDGIADTAMFQEQPSARSVARQASETGRVVAEPAASQVTLSRLHATDGANSFIRGRTSCWSTTIVSRQIIGIVFNSINRYCGMCLVLGKDSFRWFWRYHDRLLTASV